MGKATVIAGMAIGIVMLGARATAQDASAQGPMATSTTAQQTSERPASPVVPISKLAVLHGIWRGNAMVSAGGRSLRLVHTERVGPLLGGTIELIEGKSYNDDGAEAGFNALAVVSCMGSDGGCVMRSYAQGRAGTFPFTIRDDGFEWSQPAGADGVVSYRAVIGDGNWHEEGWFEKDGQRVAKVYQADLKRVGPTDWPAGPCRRDRRATGFSGATSRSSGKNAGNIGTAHRAHRGEAAWAETDMTHVGGARSGAMLAAALLVGAVAPAQPGTPPPPPPNDMPALPLKRADVPAMVARAFARIDANHDGGITEAEIRAVRRARFEAMRKDHRDREFGMLDTNHDGSLSRQEFDTPPAPPSSPGMPGGKGPRLGGPDGMGPPPGARHGGLGMLPMGGRWFEKADANQDGKVTLAEAQAAALALFDKVDANHDGIVDRNEARAMMMARWHGPHGPHWPGGPHGPDGAGPRPLPPPSGE